MRTSLNTPDQPPHVGVVIVNYNGLQFIDNCLRSLCRSSHTNWRAVVVDNDSTDGSAEYIARTYPWVELIRNKKNKLFARGANQGSSRLLKAEVDYIFLLNPDASLSVHCLEQLVNFLEQTPQAAGCQPKLLFTDKPDQIQSCGCRCSLSGRAWDHRRNEHNRSDLPEVEEVLGITGGAMMIRASVWLEAKGFCEPFGMYFEDVDLCLRLRNKGFSFFSVNTTHAFHVYSGIIKSEGMGRKYYFTERNCYWVVLRNYPTFKVLKSVSFSIPLALGMSINNLLNKRWKESVYGLVGILIGLSSFAAYLPVLAVRGFSSNPFFGWKFVDEQHVLPPPNN